MGKKHVFDSRRDGCREKAGITFSFQSVINGVAVSQKGCTQRIKYAAEIFAELCLKYKNILERMKKKVFLKKTK